MKHLHHRREFLASATTMAAGVAIGSQVLTSQAQETTFKTKLFKAVIAEKNTEAALEKLKAAGYDGVEGGVIGPEEAAKCRVLADKVGLRIHSVIRGWAEFNSPDKAKAQATFDKTVLALETAQAFGADAVLLVPCRIGGVKTPDPWDFDIEFDAQTGHLKRVVKGDNAPYAEYIKAHDHAVDTSREWVSKLIPIAEKTNVKVALENVWNNLWVKPAVFKQFVESFGSPWIRAYFDIGNHVKYAPSEEWITTLGGLIVKLHAKDFKVDRAAKSGGKFVNIREGDVNWPLVRQALEKVGYTGFLTIEGGQCTLEENSQRLSLIFGGK
ncbi:MAG: sugar phosphate isomerase/epimerase family protein [Verrucomicrobiota bacterium]